VPVQRKFSTLYYNRFGGNRNSCSYIYVLDNLKLNTLFARRLYFEELFIRNVYNGFITYLLLLEADGIRVPARNVADFDTFK
jgi:hypothetical protein